MNRAMPSRHKQLRHNRGAGRRQPALRPIELPLPPETVEDIREYFRLHQIGRELILQACCVSPSAIGEMPVKVVRTVPGKSPVSDTYEEYMRLKALEAKVSTSLGVSIDDILDDGLPRIAAMEKAIETMGSKLQEIVSWAEAYPVDIFPEMDTADWQKVRELLAGGGYTLDRVSASNMRHVITQVEAIANIVVATNAS